MKPETAKIKRVNKLLAEYFGIPKREKDLPDPLDLLIATILSQNTNDQNSFKAYQNLKRRFYPWENAANAKLSAIEKEILPAGLTKQKAKAIKGFLTELIKERRSAKLSFDKENSSEIINYLTSHNGIGIKTASCVLLFALNRNVCPVDTHVFRIVNRLGIVSAKTPEKTYWQLNENFPQGIAHQFHTNLIRLGRAICKPNKPLCSDCPLIEECEWENKNLETGNSIIKDRDFMLLDNVAE